MPHRYLILILIPTVLMIGGTVGYYLLEDRYSLFDAFYMTVITLTTVGYEEVHPPLSLPGRVFTIALLLVGVLTFFYTVTELVRVVISGEVQQLLGRRRMARSLAEMKNHMIICGYGRMGRHVCREFSRAGCRSSSSIAGRKSCATSICRTASPWKATPPPTKPSSGQASSAPAPGHGGRLRRRQSVHHPERPPAQ